MKKSAIILLSIACIAIACNETPKATSNATTKIKTKEDTLYQAVMELHNETMAKYGKLLGYEKKAQQRVDSIQQILKKSPCYCEGMHEALNRDSSLVKQLKAADKNMNDWMGQFNPDPKMPTTEERAAYFLDQKEKATIMKNGFFEVLNKADSLLGENFLEKKKKVSTQTQKS